MTRLNDPNRFNDLTSSVPPAEGLSSHQQANVGRVAMQGPELLPPSYTAPTEGMRWQTPKEYTQSILAHQMRQSWDPQYRKEHPENHPKPTKVPLEHGGSEQ